MNRRGFFGSLAALIVAPFAVRAAPQEHAEDLIPAIRVDMLVPGNITVDSLKGDYVLHAGNPADVYLEVLRGPFNAKPVPTDRIDLEAIAAWREDCERDRCWVAVESDDFSTVWSTLKFVAKIGGARPVFKGEKWSIAKIVA